MVVDEVFAAQENGSETGNDGNGETGLREALDLNFGGKGFDKNSGEEEGENTGERGGGILVSSVPFKSLGDPPFVTLFIEVLNRRNDRRPLLWLLLRLLRPDASVIKFSSEAAERFRPLDGNEKRRERGSCAFGGRFGRLRELDFESLIAPHGVGSVVPEDFGEALVDLHRNWYGFEDRWRD
jgi:hypothetical protein